MDIELRGWEGPDYNYVAQIRAKLQAHVNTIQGFRFP